MTITYTKSFASAAAFRNFFKTMKNSAIFDREYESIEFVYGDGHVGQKSRGKAGTTASTTLSFLLRKAMTEKDESHKGFTRLADIDKRGGVVLVITFA